RGILRVQHSLSARVGGSAQGATRTAIEENSKTKSLRLQECALAEPGAALFARRRAEPITRERKCFAKSRKRVIAGVIVAVKTQVCRWAWSFRSWGRESGSNGEAAEKENLAEETRRGHEKTLQQRLRDRRKKRRLSRRRVPRSILILGWNASLRGVCDLRDCQGRRRRRICTSH